MFVLISSINIIHRFMQTTDYKLKTVIEYMSMSGKSNATKISKYDILTFINFHYIIATSPL